MKETEEHTCYFGMVDEKTGLYHEGYVENGEMKFKKIPWWRRIFAKEPSETEFLGITTAVINSIFGPERVVEVAIYKKFNPISLKTQAIYGNVEGRGLVYFDIVAFEKTGKLIKK